MGEKIRILVVDDSAFMRAALSRTLGADERLEVIGQARDGAEAVEKVRALSPDVVTMDFNMPRMNGAEAVRAIMAQRPTPILMMSAHTVEGAQETLDCLSAGAVDFVTKPDGEVSTDLSGVKDLLVRKIRAAARSKPQAGPAAPSPVTSSPVTSSPVAAKAPTASSSASSTPRAGRPTFAEAVLDPVVIIAISTGGPAALERVVPRLPATFGSGVLIVQHMPAQFTSALAKRLDGISPLTVREAVAGDRISAGTVLIAPGDAHVIVDRSGSLKTTQTPPVNGCRPSADVTLQSAAPVFGRRLTALVMTGMGKDGALGASAAKAAGARILAQDKETSVVYGMPKAVADMGIVDEVLPLGRIAAALAQS